MAAANKMGRRWAVARCRDRTVAANRDWRANRERWRDAFDAEVGAVPMEKAPRRPTRMATPSFHPMPRAQARPRSRADHRRDHVWSGHPVAFFC